MEEGFSSGPAGVNCWIFLQWQPRPASSDSAVYQPAKLSVIISEPEEPKRFGAGDLYGLGDYDNSPDPAVEQSGSRVSSRVGLLLSLYCICHCICAPALALWFTGMLRGWSELCECEGMCYCQSVHVLLLKTVVPWSLCIPKLQTAVECLTCCISAVSRCEVI